MCLDGASKGNLRVAGAGGVLFGPKGYIELRFAWNLGIASNNQTEEYAFLQGIYLAKARGIQYLIIIDDSLNTIQSMIYGSSPLDAQLNNITKKI
jgi:ribonuclease HI